MATKKRKTSGKAYSKARIARLVKHHSSLTKLATALNLSKTTIIKYVNGSRQRLSAAVCAKLDDHYLDVF